MILVDANILSELTKPAPNAAVVGWLRDHESDLVVNPIILGEIEYGILIMAAGRKRVAMESWFAQLVNTLEVLEFDKPSAAAWARLLASLKQKGQSMSIKDSLIAATALHHKLQLATRNTTDFRSTGVSLIDPFSTNP